MRCVCGVDGTGTGPRVFEKLSFLKRAKATSETPLCEVRLAPIRATLRSSYPSTRLLRGGVASPTAAGTVCTEVV
jgi:hypothetical protein